MEMELEVSRMVGEGCPNEPKRTPDPDCEQCEGEGFFSRLQSGTWISVNCGCEFTLSEQYDLGGEA